MNQKNRIKFVIQILLVKTQYSLKIYNMTIHFLISIKLYAVEIACSNYSKVRFGTKIKFRLIENITTFIMYQYIIVTTIL